MSHFEILQKLNPSYASKGDLQDEHIGFCHLDSL